MMEFSRRDAKKLVSELWHQDELLSKKRRWLMATSTSSLSSGGKKYKRPKFLTDACLAESLVRNDEVSYETLRTNVEKSFGLVSYGVKNHHVVQDYLQVFETYDMESYSNNPGYFLKDFYSIMNDLSNNAFLLVANLVTEKKVIFEKVRSKMKKIIKSYLPKFIEASYHTDCLAAINQLSKIFTDPSNIRQEQLTLLTPLSPSLLTSIHKALNELDEMTSQDLMAMSRRLRDVLFVPKFPPKTYLKVRRDVALTLVKKKCQKVLSTLKEGTNMPKAFAKALSVVHLSLKYKLASVESVGISTLEFYPFSQAVVGLQNEFLQALWLLSRVTTDELKDLQPIVDPKAEVKNFRTMLRRYLLEYLFVCDEVDIPAEVSSILTCLNGRSRRRPRLFSTAVVDEEVEYVLNLSSQLKLTVSHVLPDDRSDENSASTCAYDSECDDFNLADSHYCTNLDKEHDSRVNDEEEGVGDSSFASLTPINGHQRISEQFGDFVKKEPVLEEDDSNHVNSNQCCNDINSSQYYPDQTSKNSDFMKKYDLEMGSDEKPSEHCPDMPSGSEKMRDISIQEICDETSLVGYKLIGRILEKFMHIEGRKTEEMTRYYLRGGSSSVDSSGVGGSINTSKDDIVAEVLIQSVVELLPSVSKRCIDRVKKLMGQPRF